MFHSWWKKRHSRTLAAAGWRPHIEEMEARLTPSWGEPFISASGVLTLIGTGMNNTATLDARTGVEFPYTIITASGLGVRNFYGIVSGAVELERTVDGPAHAQALQCK